MEEIKPEDLAQNYSDKNLRRIKALFSEEVLKSQGMTYANIDKAIEIIEARHPRAKGYVPRSKVTFA